METSRSLMTAVTLPPDLHVFLKRQLAELSESVPAFRWNALIEALLANLNPGIVSARTLGELIADSVAFVVSTSPSPSEAGAAFETVISEFADALAQDAEAAEDLDISLREKLGALELEWSRLQHKAA